MLSVVALNVVAPVQNPFPLFPVNTYDGYNGGNARHVACTIKGFGS